MFGFSDNGLLPILLLLFCLGNRRESGCGCNVEHRDGFREEINPCLALLVGIACGSLFCGEKSLF